MLDWKLHLKELEILISLLIQREQILSKYSCAYAMTCGLGSSTILRSSRTSTACTFMYNIYKVFYVASS